VGVVVAMFIVVIVMILFVWVVMAILFGLGWILQ
jgi:hypothetical protein